MLSSAVFTAGTPRSARALGHRLHCEERLYAISSDIAAHTGAALRIKGSLVRNAKLHVEAALVIARRRLRVGRCAALGLLPVPARLLLLSPCSYVHGCRQRGPAAEHLTLHAQNHT